MAEGRRIGFLHEEKPQPKKKSAVRLRGVKQEVKTMLRELSIETETQRHILAVEKKLRKELARLYKRIRKLEAKIEQRNILYDRMRALQEEFPEKALTILRELANPTKGKDVEIRIEAQRIKQDFQSYYPHKLNEIYRGIELSAEQQKHVRVLLTSMGKRLEDKFAKLNELSPPNVQALEQALYERIQANKK